MIGFVWGVGGGRKKGKKKAVTMVIFRLLRMLTPEHFVVIVEACLLTE
jgi:hypothetical protein